MDIGSPLAWLMTGKGKMGGHQLYSDNEGGIH